MSTTRLYHDSGGYGRSEEGALFWIAIFWSAELKFGMGFSALDTLIRYLKGI